MSLKKVDYIDQETIIEAENLNDIQDSIIALEETSPDAIVNTASGEAVVISDSSGKKLAGLSICGKSTQAGTPTPAAPVDVVSVGDDGEIVMGLCGKNLLPITISAVGEKYTNHGMTFVRNSDNSITINGTATETAFYNMDYVGGNATYPVLTNLVASASGLVDGVRMVVGYFNASGAAVDSVTTLWYYSQSKEYQLPADAVRGRTYLLVDKGVTFTNVLVYPMIRLASTSPTYEAYTTAQTYPITTNGLRGIPVTDKALATYTDASGKMWCTDEIDLARGVYIKRINKKTVTAETVITKHEYSNDNFFIAIIRESQKNASTDCLSTHFVKTTSGEALRTTACVYCMSNMVNAIHVSVPTTTANDITTFKNWAISNNLVVYHILATPVETPLTAEQIAAYKALHTNKPNTTIINYENAYMTVKYIADPKSYIDNKVASAILTATVE